MRRLQVFLTVGSQMPFDRLTEMVAQWARQRPAVAVTAQIGSSRLAPGALQPMRCAATLDASAYSLQCQQAQLMVAHAGMGSILTAMELNLPLLILPRRGHLHETRNDHQLHTALYLMRQQAQERAPITVPCAGRFGVEVVLQESDLPARLDRVCQALLAQHAAPQQGMQRDGESLCSMTPPDQPLKPTESGAARASLIEHLRTVIQSAQPD